MKISEIKQLFSDSLAPLFPAEEIGSFFTMVASHYLGYSRFETVMHASENISEEKESYFLEALDRLKQQEPIQYILGTTHFYGHDFKVNSHTLIPRPETEELVHWIIDDIQARSQQTVHLLDMGTGSGCIAISLAHELSSASVSALDISEEALNVARLNAEQLEVEVDFFQTDLLSLDALPMKYNAIVSNPPYVRELEKDAMEENVLRFEPGQALFVSNEDPLRFYRKITQLARGHLSSEGSLYLEINEYLSEEMHALLLQEGFTSVVLKNDLFGKPRMMKAQL